MKNITQQKIVPIARTWIGTPYHEGAQQKEIGTDCGGIVLGVIEELVGVKLIRTKVAEELLMRYCRKIEAPQPGDILLFKEGGEGNAHLAICGDYREGGLSMIHACLKNQGVIEHRLTIHIKNKIHSVWRLRC